MDALALQQRACHMKRRYFDQTSAVIVANKRAAKGAPMLRAYQCPHCGGWHLTKQIHKE